MRVEIDSRLYRVVTHKEFTQARRALCARRPALSREVLTAPDLKQVLVAPWPEDDSATCFQEFQKFLSCYCHNETLALLGSKANDETGREAKSARPVVPEVEMI